MAELLVLSSTHQGEALPALSLLSHSLRTAPLEPTALLQLRDAVAVVIDARAELARARAVCQVITSTGLEVPSLVVLTEGGLAAIGPDWGVTDFILTTAGPAEVEARLRLLARPPERTNVEEQISAGELSIDSSAYTARIRGKSLDLTYKEFELLKYFSQHPAKVFTRAQLLQEVWGYDYFGGTRTVDVHVRRLRAKLGPEHDAMISTVRHVGYRFDPPGERRVREAAES